MRAKAFSRPDSCGLISLFRLATPVFGGKRALAIAFATSAPAKATVAVRRGARTVRTFRVSAPANRAQLLRLKAKGLKAGSYQYHCEYHPDQMKGTITVT